MKLDPNSRLFDRVPDLFQSPFPGADAYADEAFQALLSRANSIGARGTIGQSLLVQASAQAWNQATQMLWKAKATQVGDILPSLWSSIAWVNPKKDSIAGVLAEVPFPLTTDPNELLRAAGTVALDLALDLVTAVPVVGRIAGIAVGLGQALAPLFANLAAGDSIPADRRNVLPWRRYTEKLDESWVRTFVTFDAVATDWTPAFAPPTDARPWQLADGLDEQGNKIGQVLAPFAGKSVAWNGSYGCIPGTFRVAGILQHRGRPQTESEARFYADGTMIQRYGDFTQTGDFYPCLQQVAGTAWQQVAAGGPDTYKVDCAALESLWRDWFTALYTSALEQDHGDWLLAYLARELADGEWRLGTDISGAHRAEAEDYSTVPMVTQRTIDGRGLAEDEARTNCFFTDIDTKKGRVQSGYLPPRWARDPKTKAYVAPPVDPRARAHLCTSWPHIQLLLQTYGRADDKIVLPALRTVAKLQRRRLATTLDCAYVRPDPVGDKPAYAAFRDPRLRSLCLSLRRRLLKHPSRMLVEYETAREVDPVFAAALKDAGVPTTLPQRAAARFQIRAAASAPPLDPNAPEPDPPLNVMGGLAFEPGAGPTSGRSRWLGPALLGGAALATTIAVAVGVRQSRRARGR